MSLLGAFTNSVQAMQAQSQNLGVISQNIANVNTNGYKEANDQFQTMLSEVTAPANIFGVKPTTRTMVDVQGIINGSDRNTDLAISGKGFFILNSSADGSGGTHYSRDGALVPKVLGPSASTTSTATSSTNATSTAKDTYLTNNSGNYLMGWMADSSGVVTPGTSLKGLQAIHYALGTVMDPVATTTVSVQGTVPSNYSLDPSGKPAVQSVGLAVYDTAGNVQTLSLDMTPLGGDQWGLNFSTNATNRPATPQAIVQFDGAGNFLSVTGSTTANVNWTNSATTPPTTTTGSINVDLSKLSQLASSNFQLDKTKQDGYPGGTMDSVTFDDQGLLTGHYTNGQQKLIAQLPIASFVAPNSLQADSGNLFSQTADAGALTVSTVGAMGTQTALQTNAQELSNVKMENEFTNMITTQTAYSTASKVFQTADEMTTSVRDLIV